MRASNDRALFGPLWRTVAILVFLFSAYWAASQAAPFQPYKYLYFRDVPETVCANGAVELQAERHIVEPLLGSLDYAEVSSNWIEVDTGKVVDGGMVPVPIQAAPPEQVPSPVIREAPAAPGVYYLQVDTKAYGKIMLTPRDSTITTTTDTSTEVVECGGESES